jgi:hypothetical protein
VLREVTLEGHTIRVRGKSLTRARVQSQFPAQVVVERSVGQPCEEISGEQSEVLALRQRPQRGSDSWGEGSKSEGTRACSCTERLSSRAAFASSPASDVRPESEGLCIDRPDTSVRRPVIDPRRQDLLRYRAALHQTQAPSPTAAAELAVNSQTGRVDRMMHAADQPRRHGQPPRRSRQGHASPSSRSTTARHCFDCGSVPSRMWPILSSLFPNAASGGRILNKKRTLRLPCAYPCLERARNQNLTHCFIWCPQRDSNSRPSDYKSDALPAEL